MNFLLFFLGDYFASYCDLNRSILKMHSTTRTHIARRLYEDDNFCKLQNNKARVDYVLTNVFNYENFYSTIKSNLKSISIKSRKSVTMAQCYMKEADQFMSHSLESTSSMCSNKESNLFEIKNSNNADYEQALSSYKKAISYTPPNEIALLSKLYARLARVYYNKFYFEASLYAIDQAIEFAQSNSKKSVKNCYEYFILKINLHKLMKQYGKAAKLINRLIVKNELDISEKTFKESELRELRRQVQVVQIKNLKFENKKEAVEQVENKLAKKQSQEGKDEKMEKNQKDNNLNTCVTPYFSYRLEPLCEIKSAPNVGRHFIARDFIESNTVLLEEKPYSIVLSAEKLQHKCSACHHDLKYRFYSCFHCNELVFCDRKCALNAYNTFHRHECGIVGLLMGIAGSTSLHVFRMISRIGPLEALEAEHSLSDYSIHKFLAEENQRIVPETEKTKDEKLRAHKMASLLLDHNEKHGNSENVHHTLNGIEITVLLDLVFNFRNTRSEYQFLLQFIDMIIKSTRRIVFNVFGWQEFDQDWNIIGNVAHAECLVGSLINHSCVPNTQWEFSDEGMIKFTTLRPILKGEEITISYGTYQDMDFFKRQKRLSHYYFACKCDICAEDARIKCLSIRCPSCCGPVVLGSFTNIEPTLNGNCLYCYKKHPHLKQNISKLNQIKDSFTILEPLGDILSCHDFVKKEAIDMMNLAYEILPPNSAPLFQCIELCSAIVAKIDGNLISDYSLNEKTDFVLLIARYLLNNLPKTDELKSQPIAQFQFWFDILLDCISEFGKDYCGYNAYESELWSLIGNIYQKLSKSIHLWKEGQHFSEWFDILENILEQRIWKNQQKLRKHVQKYASHLALQF